VPDEGAPMTPEQIAPVGLAYPKSANGTPLDHDDDCAFAYGNSGYACYCFVPRAHIDTLTAALRETTEAFHALNWHDRPVFGRPGYTLAECPIERCRINRDLWQRR
jgi:hypothetical protein